MRPLRRRRSPPFVAAIDRRCDTDDVTTRSKHTRADLAGLAPNVVGELVLGTLHVSPRPAMRHGRAAVRIGFDLVGPFDRGHGSGGPGGWWIQPEPELQLGEDVVVPDLGGWRREHVPVLPDVAAMTTAPDWVCEILSPKTAAWDRATKMPRYVEAGVRHPWLVDPIARTLEVYAAHDSRWVVLGVHANDEHVRAAPFDAVALDLAPWWDRGEPSAS